LRQRKPNKNIMVGILLAEKALLKSPYVKRYALMYTTFAVQWYSKSITGDLLCHMQLKI